MRQIFKPILALSALALSGLAMMILVNPAAAAMVSQTSAYSHVQGSGVQLPVELVARRHRYDRRQHGNRYRSRRAGYTHYYGGYWYRSTWWLVDDPIVVGVFGASRERCSYVRGQCTLRHGYGNGIFWLCMKNDDCA